MDGISVPILHPPFFTFDDMRDKALLRLRQLITKLRFGGEAAFQNRRRLLAEKFIQGEGIEIGALHSPLPLPDASSVTYVDRLTLDQLHHHYPELPAESFVPVHVIDDGETLSSFEDSSQGFIVGNHLLEHCENPIGTLENWMRVLKPGGCAYLAVPDKRVMFDHRRQPTTIEHVVRDWHEGPEWSRRSHYEEWARLVEGVPLAEVSARARHLLHTRYSIHFHVWTPRSFRALLTYCQKKLGFQFRIVAFVRNGIETIGVITRENP
jgi:SAM-dependent methyltransferase